MNQTVELLVPLLAYLASGAGSGTLAWATIERVRARWTEPELPGWIDQQFYSPAPTRLTAFTLSVVFAAMFNTLIALLTGQDVLGAFDRSISGGIGQLDQLFSGMLELGMAGTTGFAVSQGLHASTSLPRPHERRRSVTVDRGDLDRLVITTEMRDQEPELSGLSGPDSPPPKES